MSRKRFDQLTFTRFLAAISIVVFHYGKDIVPFNNNIVSFLFKQANVGVSYFFVLSGFVMMIAYQRYQNIGFKNFIIKRFARIYPAYFVALFLVCVFLYSMSAFNWLDLVLNILLIQSWFPDKALTLNFPGWSLSVEFFFYLMFPVLFNRVYRRIKTSQIVFSIALIWLFNQIIFHYVVSLNNQGLYNYVSFSPLFHLNEFLVGNMAGLIFVNSYQNRSKNFDLLLVGFVISLIFVLRFSFGLNYHNGLLALIFAPLIFLLARNDGKITQLFDRRLPIFLGEISYGIYIYQLPVWLIFTDYRLSKYFGLDRFSDWNFYIKLLVLILVSSISYLWIEQPIRNYTGKIVKSRMQNKVQSN